MNVQTLLWLLAYAVVGLIVFATVVSIVAASIKSVRPERTYKVTIDLGNESYEGQIEATVPTPSAAMDFVSTWSPRSIKPTGIKEIKR